MARNDDSQRGQGTPSRVYKSSDVHKRRVDRKGRTKDDAKIAASPLESEGAPAQAQPGQASLDADPKSAVVISPEFGRRTDAQRQADDRWFAAMRDANAPAEALEGMPQRPEEAESALEGEASPSPADGPKPADTAVAPSAPIQTDRSSHGGGTPAAPQVQEGAESSVPVGVDERQAAEEASPTPEPESTRPSATKRSDGRLPKKRSHRIVAIIAAVVLVAAIVAASLFVWNRWYRYDDHADMQGTWYVVGTTVPIAIDETSIQLTSDVTYQYEINTHDKTIRFTFGPMEGQGRYWFSDDRQYLVITDGSDFDGTSTTIEDLAHTFSDVSNEALGSGMKLPEGEGIVAFSRVPDPDALAREEAEAEAKAKAEEEARKEEERKAAEEAAAWEDDYYEEEAPAEEAPAEEAPAEEAPAEEAPAEEAPAEETPTEGEQAQ